MLRALVASLLSVVCLAGCASTPRLKKPTLAKASSPECEALWNRSDVHPPEQALASLSRFFENGCDHETISLGRRIRETYRDKVYSITDESWKFVGFAGSTDYVLEGYERTFLSLLIARSHLRLGDNEATTIELRRASEEQRAKIHTVSDDPVNELVMAALWENVDEPDHARATWRRLTENSRASFDLKAFARKQIRRLDQGGLANRRKWTIEHRGRAPKLSFEFVTPSLFSTYYRLVPESSYPTDRTEGDRLISASTRPWFEELAARNRADSRPLEYAQSLARGAVGLTWSAVGLSTGVVVGLAGCVGNHSTKESCEASGQIGWWIAETGFKATGAHLKPDLRHWDGLPSLIELSAAPQESLHRGR